MNVIRDAVVEAEGVRTDARVLERKDRNRGAQELLTEAILGDECIYVGRVGRGVERYERRVHVARRASRCVGGDAGEQDRAEIEGAAMGCPSGRSIVGLR